MGLRFDGTCVDAADPTALGTWSSEALGWPHDVDDDGDVVLHPPSEPGPSGSSCGSTTGASLRTASTWTPAR